MAYGKIKADTLVYDNSGSDVEKTIASLAASAPTASPTFTGTPAAPTAAANTNNTQIATTEFVHTNYATKDSPTFVGTPAAPTAAANTNNTQIATTAYVDGSFAPLAAPALTGNATAVNLTLSGNLTVNGTTTTVSSSTLEVADKNIELGKVSTPTDTTADGGGITLKGATDKTITWVDSTDAWTFNQNLEISAASHSHLLVKGVEGGEALVYLYADEGDDNADKWRIQSTTGGDFKIETYSTGSWVSALTANGSGNITGAGTVSDSKGNLRSIPTNSPSSNHVAVAADAGKCIYIAYDVTINPSVFAAGDAVTIVNNSANDETILQGTSFTLYNSADASTGNRTLAGRGMATIWFADHNIGYISGAGLS